MSVVNGQVGGVQAVAAAEIQVQKGAKALSLNCKPCVNQPGPSNVTNGIMDWGLPWWQYCWIQMTMSWLSILSPLMMHVWAMSGL